MAEFLITQSQLNNLAKGRPIQVKYAGLTSANPNTSVAGMGQHHLKKIRRAIAEKRGVRLTLSPDEIANIETSLNGGKLNIGKAFKKFGSDVKHAFRKGGEAEKFGKDVLQVVKPLAPLARPALKGLATAGVTALTTLAGNPELAPFISPLVNRGIDAGLNKAKIGIGIKEDMKAKMTRLRGMRKGVKGAVSSAVSGVRSGVKSAIREIEDMDIEGGAVPIGLARPRMTDGGSFRGYGVSKKVLSGLKKDMTKYFEPHVDKARHALQLTNKVFKHGADILDLPEIKVSGGKINLKKIGKTLKKGANELLQRAKPVLKHFGQEAIAYAKPLVSEAIKGVAESYGIDPALTEVATNMVLDKGEKLANRGLDKYVTKKDAQTPEYALNKLQGDAQHYAKKQVDRGIEKGRQRGHEAISKYVPTELQDMARAKLEEVHEKTKSGYDTADLFGGGSFRGYGMRDDMGTLLNQYHPATTPFVQSNMASIPQGQISGGMIRSCSCGGEIGMLKGSSRRSRRMMERGVAGMGGSFCC
jgi:hypothetical protein